MADEQQNLLVSENQPDIREPHKRVKLNYAQLIRN